MKNMIKSKEIPLDSVYFHHEVDDRTKFVYSLIKEGRPAIIPYLIQFQYQSLNKQVLILRVHGLKTLWLWVFYPEWYEIYVIKHKCCVNYEISYKDILHVIEEAEMKEKEYVNEQSKAGLFDV